MPFTVGQLMGSRMPVTVLDTDSVKHAQDVMTSNSFSQLPVVNKNNKALGMITNESILSALHTFGVVIDNMYVKDAMSQMRVLDAMYEVKRTYYTNDSIFLLIEDLKETNAVLIVDHEQRLVSIITSYDTTEYFRMRAEDLMYAEEIEAKLKEFIDSCFFLSNGSLDIEKRDAVIKSIRNKKYEKLTQHDFVEILLHDSLWEKYSSIFSFEHDTVHRMLIDAKDTRNDAAHFHTEDISTEQRQRLKFCRDWLYRHASLVSAVFESNTTDISEQQVEDIKNAETPSGIIEESTLSNDDNKVNANTEEISLEKQYSRLSTWLQKVPIDKERISLNFKGIEEIIGEELPASARLYPVWWSNNFKVNPQAQQWWEAGWNIATVRMPEEVVVFRRIEGRKKAYVDFFSSLLAHLDSLHSFPMRNSSPTGTSWLTLASVPSNDQRVAYLGFSFARRKRFRIELYIDTGNELKNKDIFNKLRVNKDKIEEEIGVELGWELLEGVRASRIACYHAGAITDTVEELDTLRNWAVETMLRFQPVMEKYVSEVTHDL